MRGKRAKQYRKLMHHYGITFGFREPYQVLLDAQIIMDAARYKMNLVGGLERTLQGKVKPMVTQCSMRHLYTLAAEDQPLISHAKTYERRRCNHHTLENPLSTIECFSSVLNPKGNETNKHRYIVASQDGEVRETMRRIPGVPLLYISRSVMIMEPMAGATEEVREREERGKFRMGIKKKPTSGNFGKRKRDSNEVNDAVSENSAPAGFDGNTESQNTEPSKPKKTRGPKGPNPLSVKKPQQRLEPNQATKHEQVTVLTPGSAQDNVNCAADGTRQRKRKHKSSKHEHMRPHLAENVVNAT